MPIYNFCIYKYNIFKGFAKLWGHDPCLHVTPPLNPLVQDVSWFSTKAIEWTNDARYIMLKFNQKPILTHFLFFLLSKKTYQEKEEEKVTTFIFE